jgi:hypothetical protein
MNKVYIRLGAILFLFAFACMNSGFGQTVSPKRGTGGDLVNQADLQAATNLQWYYNWDDLPNSAVTSISKNYLEFTPMRWGATGDYNRAALVSYLTAHPEVDYLLGFNEPNFKEQANLTPSQAAALWPEIESVANQFNLKIVGPALNFCYAGGAVVENGVEYIDPVKWYDDFLAKCTNCRVDYIAIHGYFDHQNGMAWYLDLFRKYNKPMWVTEFNQSASWTTPQTQREYMVETVSLLEKDPAVFRYAWFLTRANGINSTLFDPATTGQLTELGLIYTNMSSYDKNFYHPITASIQAEHWIDRSGVLLEKTSDASGGTLSTYSMDANDWLEYNIDIPQSTQYDFNFRLATTAATSFQILSNGTLKGTIQIPATGSNLDVWATVKGSITLDQGKQKIRIIPTSNAFGLKLNWFNVSFTQCHFVWNSTTNYTTGWVISYNGKSYKALKASKGKTPGTTANASYWQYIGSCGGSLSGRIATNEVSMNTEETDEQIVTVFPNPSSKGTITIKTELKNYNLDILDFAGKTKHSARNLSGSQVIDTHSYSSGYYILKMKSAKGIAYRKFVIE